MHSSQMNHSSAGKLNCCVTICALMLSTLGKIFSRHHIEVFFFFFLFFPRKQDMAFHGDNLHEVPNLFSGEIRKISSLYLLVN